MMRASEDNADDEFVFVPKKVVTARECPPGDTLPASGGRLHRTLPRLNHLQPIPTILDLQPSPLPRSGLSPPTTTTARSKATPLPPELIELLPPHLRENTVPDFGSSTPPPSLPTENGVDEAAPARPPLPAKYCPGDYYNLDDTPSLAASASSSSSSSERQLSGLIASNSLSAIGPTHSPAHHGGRAASLASTRPQALPTTTTSHTAPAALALTDSGISSGGSSSSSSCSSVSSRSSSSKSLPREGSRTSLSGRPLHPPSPKFARASPAPSLPAATTASGPEPLLTRVSYTAVLTSDGERASMVRRLEALTPTPSPLLNTFRAANAHAEHLPPEAHPHTRHVATAHSTLTSMGQTKSTSSTSVTTHAPTPSHTPSQTPTHTPTHTPTQRRKIRNGDSAPQAPMGQGAPIMPAGVRHVNPAKPVTSGPSTSTPSSPRPQYRQFSGRPPDSRPISPPPSPELRRAWNVVGVPVVSQSCSATPLPRSPAPSPVPRPFIASEPDSIYDNLVVRQPPLCTPAARSPPTASVPPTTQRPGAPSIYRQGPPATPPPRSVSQSPIIGKPPSPPTQRRASRSPTPPGRTQQGVPQRGQYVPYYPSTDAHCGGCWVPVWGSSPQLYQGPGSPPVYPAYVYHVPPAGVVCERSRSCERLPAHPSPPSSPRSGRRSASPWRGGSPSPAGARHSPSPDPVSGRPPRPRRPPMRKSKTVEVGCLGVGIQQPPGAPGAATSEPTPLPVHSITYLQGPPAPGVPSNHVYIHALNPPPYHKCNQPGKQHIPTIDTIHEQLSKVSNGFHDPHVTKANGVRAGSVGSRSSTPCNTPHESNKLEQSEVNQKSKVTYKSSLYKCMKNLLKPIQ